MPKNHANYQAHYINIAYLPERSLAVLRMTITSSRTIVASRSFVSATPKQLMNSEACGCEEKQSTSEEDLDDHAEVGRQEEVDCGHACL